MKLICNELKKNLIFIVYQIKLNKSKKKKIKQKNLS